MLVSKFNKLIHRLGYDRIKEEYMLGKYGTLTDKQLEKVLNNSSHKGRGGVNFVYKPKSARAK